MKLVEAMIGATVSKVGTSIGAVADFDGNYSVALEPGLHTIQFQFVSYTTITVESVEIKAGEVTTMDMRMSPDVQTLEAVVVEAEVLRDTEAALLTIQKKSPNLLDGVSSQTFRKTGDSNLASAIKRVTGVSVQGGKYVYVRGLGDRYTKTTLNGLSIPGLDPDRNDVQIDIFPTSVLENVVVYKTFSPDLQGDFTGGTVNVETKSFPEEKRTSFSVGFGFNPDMHFQENFLTQEGSSTDFLGFDNGTRKLPFNAQTDIPHVVLDDPQLEDLTRSLNPELNAVQERNFMNYSLSFNHGNQKDLGNMKVGYTAILNYQNNSSFNDNLAFGEYTIDDNANVEPLFVESLRTGPQAQKDVLWSGLLSGAVKFDRHSFTASLLRTQNGIETTTERRYKDFEESGAEGITDVLTYTQRSVTNGIISGKHKFDRLQLEWANGLTFARIYDPDFRVSSIALLEEGNTTLSRGAGGGVDRFWRDLNEINENFRVDLELPFGEMHKLKFGAMTLMKWRTFDVYSFFIRRTTESGVPTNPDWILQPENIWTLETEEGSYIDGNYEAANNFEARSAVNSVYAMGDSRLLPGLRAVYGFRVEQATMNYTGQNNFGTKVYDDERTLDEINVLPSANLVYSVTDQMNVRASYGRTLARPSFKEKSIAQIADPISGRTFNGNIDLGQTNIDNYDVRWETFFGSGEMISISGFYKKFDGHIELVTFEVAPDNVIPRNIDNSEVYGIEFEFRKNFGFISPVLDVISFGSNISLAESRVDTRTVIVNEGLSDGPEDDVTEYQSRLNTARTGEEIDPFRPMAGQAPYLINGYLNFTSRDRKYNANLSYNVQGESILIVGNNAVPNVYTQPFHSMNLNAYYNFGKNDQSRLTFGVNNILNDDRLDQYVGYNDATATYNIWNPGRTFSIKYSHTF